MFNTDSNLMEKWAPVLEHADLPKIDSGHKAATVARLLENQEIAAREEQAAVQGNFISEAAPANSVVQVWVLLLVTSRVSILFLSH